MRSAWGLEIDRDLDWRQRAACGPDTAEWFWLYQKSGPAALTKENRAALELCRTCPVVAQCIREEESNRIRDSHIAGGLIWTIEGPRLPPKPKEATRGRR